MASDDKKAKTGPAPKTEIAAPKKAQGAATDKSSPPAEASKIASGETAAATPINYSRGEGQKPVTQTYKDNWNAIYGNKKTAKKKKTKKKKR